MKENKECDTDILKCLGNEIRYQIMNKLIEDDKYVNELTQELEKEQTLVSHHLRELRECGLIEKKREGRKMLYTIINEELVDLIEKINKLNEELTN